MKSMVSKVRSLIMIRKENKILKPTFLRNPVPNKEF
jgi:hypothetical protein